MDLPAKSSRVIIVCFVRFLNENQSPNLQSDDDVDGFIEDAKKS